MSSPVPDTRGHRRFVAEVSALWRDVLGAGPARAGEDFFAAGGDSIMAAALVARVREVLGEVSLQDFVADPTPEGLARALVGRAGARADAAALVQGASAGAVSYAQERFWFIDQTSEGSAVSNVSWALRLRGELDVAALERALRDLAARHDSLRMGFKAGEAGPRAVVADAVELVLERVEAQSEDEAHALAGALAQRPFELGHAPLLRVALLRLGDQDHVLQFVAHHIVCDDWTKGVLLGDLGDLYAASRDSGATQPPAPVSYLAFAQWQRERLDADALARELEHWQGELAGTSFALELPTDRPRPRAPSTRGARLRTAVPAPLAEQLRALGRERGATFFMTMLAAFEALLHHYSGQDDFVVGTAIDNRDRIELETGAGLYTNVLALRCELDGAPSFHQLLAQARARVLAAIAHQELPFDRLAAAVAQRDPSRHPVFQAFYEFIVPAPLALEIDGISSEPFEVPKHTSEFDLGLYLDEQHGGLDAVWEYSTDLFEPATIARMAGHFLTLLAAVLQAPAAPIDELELLAPEERERILVQFNHVAPPPSAAPVHERFAAHVAAAPGAPALVAADGALSYDELHQRSDAIAWALREQGVGEGDRVALALDRRSDLIAGMLAVLKLGAAFVPLNPDHPPARLLSQLRAAGARAVVGDRTPAGFDGPVLDPAQVAPAESQGPFPVVPVGSEALAYVLFTSGSTGEPKGVAVTHANLANYTAHMTAALGRGGTTAGLHFGSVSAVSTDLGNTAIFPALAGGGCLHLVASEIATDAALFAAYLAAHPLDVLKITPSHLSSLLDTADPRGVLPRRWLVVGGEALTWELAQRLSVAGGPRVLNHYGPTEATIGATTYEITPGAPRAASATVPIGRPISGNRAYVLGTGLRPVPIGVPGELCLGGAGVAAGYLGADEQTAARFLADPWHPGDRIYRTGDRARWLPDGSLEFLGRVDEQVKIRGFRVEPAEVQAVLMRQRGIRQAAVVAAGEGERRHLIAYVVGEGADPPALMAALQETLPAYMVPASIVPMPGLPLTSNGKLDRAALPAPEAPPSQTATPEPLSELEAQLAAIWSELLGCQVGPQDDFFDLGGHSLLAIRLIARTRKELGTKLTLKSLMDASTVRGLAAKIEAVRAAATPAAPAPAVEPAPPAAEPPPAATPALPPSPTIPPVGRDRPLRCSFIQEQLWLIDQLTPGTTAYNFSWPMRIRGPLAVGALRRAVAELVSRHEALRTRFAAVDGQPLQIVDPPGGVALELLTVPAGPDRERELARLIDETTATVFDLARGPLVRFHLLELDAEDHVLVLVVHHIVFDGVSKVVLYRELGELYAAFAAGHEPQLGSPAVQYADYAEWQRTTLDAETIDEGLAHWREQLAGIPAALELPADRPRPAVASLRGARLRVPLARELRDGLERIAREQRTTFFTAILTAFDVLLYRYSGQEDVIVGTPVDTRSRAELETVVGPFINTVVVRSDLSGSPTFTELLRRVHERTMEAIEHHELPFERLVEALAPERDLSRHPIFQALLALNPPERGLELTGTDVTELDPAWSAARVDMFLILDDLATGMEAIWEYSTDLFERETIAQMARHFMALLTSIVADPARPIDELVMVDAAEHDALQALNATEAEIPPGRLEVLIAEQAQRTPTRVAVQAGSRSLTYAELDAAANRLAHRLHELDVGPEELVGICLPRSEHMLVALLGVLKAGAAYVPIDPSFPASRRTFMLEDAQARVIVTEQSLAAELAATGGHLVRLDADGAALARQLSTAPRLAVDADALAYVIYTSGSTGRPKGVEITHRNLVNFMESMAREPGLGADDVLVAVTTLSFDIAGLELYLPLLRGARVVVASGEEVTDPRALAELIERSGATVMQATPTTWRMLLDSGWAAPPAFRVLCGGEALPPALADELLGAGVQLWNMYGPTETTIWSTVQPIHTRGDAMSIGRPIANTTVHVLDRRGAAAPLGVPGELHIGGAGVARGYRGRPELTAERFIPDPVTAQDGARLYRTGDVVRLRPDGTLQFLGRLDHQVKLRGYRIELGEIEATLERQAGVAAAAATIHAMAGGEPSLVAYVVPSDGPIDPGALTQRLAESLPAYMVPAVIVGLDALPLTPNAKVDRAALPAPERHRGPQRAYVAPRGEREILVADLFAEVLRVQRVGAGDDFFALGGQSLLAARLISRLQARTGVQLPLRIIFEAPTVAGLAQHLDAPAPETVAAPPSTSAPPVPTSAPAPAHAGPPPLLPAVATRPASYAQERFWFIDEMGARNGAYNISWPVRLQGPLDVMALERALSELVARHEVLRARFVVEHGRPVQVIDPPGRLRLEFVDLGADGGDAAVLTEVDRRTVAAFDLAEGPLIRAALLRIGPEDHVLQVVVHHIVADGWSKVIFFAELDALYRAVRENRPAPLAPLPLQYADFAQWQRSWLQGEVVEREVAWWRAELDGVPAALELPSDRPRPTVASMRGGWWRAQVPEELVTRLQTVAAEEGATFFMVMLAAYAVLLHRYSGQDDLVVGTPVDTRDQPALEQLIGPFVNTLALRVDADGTPSFRELLARVRRRTLDALEHQNLPFERLVEAIAPERDLARHPLFQVLLTMAPDEPGIALDGCSASELETQKRTSRVDLTLLLSRRGRGLEAVWEYSSDLFDRETVAQMARHFLTLLNAIADGTDRPIDELELLQAGERAELLARAGGPDPGFEVFCLHERFARQAARSPEAVAASNENRSVTYAELDARANQIARRLRELGVRRGALVALCLERSVDLVAAILGVLKAGGAYVPLDPDEPASRLTVVFEDCQAGVLITQESARGALPAFPGQVLSLDADLALDATSSEPPPSESSPEDLACVIYTSGSSGQPKGVMVEHRNVARLFTATEAWFEPGPQDTWSLLHSPASDVSLWELWGALLYGGRLVVVPQSTARSPTALAELLVVQRVTVLSAAVAWRGRETFTPSVFMAVMDELRARAGQLALRLVMIEGEALSTRLLKPWYETFGDGGPRLVTMYGITETTVHAAYRPLGPADAERDGSPLGVPVPDLRLYVLDDKLAHVPEGVPGQLFVGGAGVARGYLNHPELTSERFVPDPFDAAPGARLYRTGDRARWRRGAGLHFEGRLDDQVKVRGFHIELGEIQAVLAEHPAVADCAVIARAGDGDVRLAAYVAPDAAAAPVLRRLLTLERSGRLSPEQRRELPGGLVVAHANQRETDYLYEEIFASDSYFRHGIGLPPDACVFDVGANIGMFSLRVGLGCPQARIFAFEPVPPVFSLLAVNTELYGLHATLLDCGLAAERSEATFTYFPFNSLISGRFVDIDAEREAVLDNLRAAGEASDAAAQDLLSERMVSESFTRELRTLSDVMAEHGVTRIDLLKIDAERGELDVLAGIDDEDWAKIQQLVLEAHGPAAEVADIVQALQDRGYRVAVERDAEATPTGEQAHNIYARRETATGRPPALPAGRFSPAALRSELRERLADRLPNYMLPSTITLVDEIPLTANGTLDARRLPAPTEEHRPTSTPPSSESECALAALWAEVLDADGFGIDDDFFELGGHSVLAAALAARVRDRLGAPVAVRDVFEARTIRRLAERVDQAGTGTGVPSEGPMAIPSRRPGEPWPLSHAQEQLWLIDQWDPGAPTYGVALAFSLEGSLDTAALQRALEGVLERHEALRTVITVQDDHPVPTVLANPLIELERCPAPDATDAEVMSLLSGRAARPFDFSRDVLLRATVIDRAADRHVLLLQTHHIAFDGWSEQVLLDDLAALYAGRALPELPIQYGDFALWERARLQGRLLEDKLGFWRAALAGAPTTIELPTDHPRPAGRRFSGAIEELSLGPEVGRAARALCREADVTPYMLVLAALSAVLYRITGQDDILIGSPAANRASTEVASVIGFFSNTLVFRARLGGDPTFRELLARVRDMALDVYGHQDVPLQKIVEALAPERAEGVNPLFQVNLRVRDSDRASLALPGLEASRILVDVGLARFDLALDVEVVDRGVSGYFRYNSDIFEPATVAAIAQEFAALFIAAVRDPERRLLSFELARDWHSAQPQHVAVAAGGLRNYRRRERASSPES